jgi:hypothetical protein
MTEKQIISNFISPAKAAGLLSSKHGALSAQKLAMSELRKARRARSRRRFNFWATVATHLASRSEATTLPRNRQKLPPNLIVLFGRVRS